MAFLKNELRRFGLVVGGVFCGIAAYFLLTSGHVSSGVKVCGGIGLPLVLLGLAYPPALRPVQAVWMRIAHVLGWINTRLILIVVFYTTFVLGRLYLMLRRRDLMCRRPDATLATYWVEVPQKPVDPESYEHPF